MNSHDLRHQHLKLACLPIPPSPRDVFILPELIFLVNSKNQFFLKVLDFFFLGGAKREISETVFYLSFPPAPSQGKLSHRSFLTKGPLKTSAVQTALLYLEMGKFHAEACPPLGYGAQVCGKAEHLCHRSRTVDYFAGGF